MRSVKKLLKKAMVFTLAAAMLVGTPLTASAAPLNEVFQIEDGFGNVIGNETNTATGTVSATDTNSGILDANAKLVGISLDETNLEFELPAKNAEDSRKTLTAALEWEDGAKDAKLEAELLKTLRWESSDTAVATVQVPNSERGKPGDFGTADDPKSRDKIWVNAKGAGTAVITVTLKSEEHGIYYTAQAAVTVVQYAEKIGFDQDKIKEDAYSGNIANPSDWVVTTPAKVSDQITYTVVDNNSPKISQYNAKKNTLTFKNTAGEKSIWIKAVGKKISSEWTEIKIAKGINVKTIKFDDKKCEIKVNDKLTANVTATMTPSESGKEITDKLTWSSKKPEIVKIVSCDTKKPYAENKCKATLEAVSAGKTQITVQSSNGKKATLSVTVSADLSTIKIDPATAKYYSGQVVDLSGMATLYFAKEKGGIDNPGFGDAAKLIKWRLAKDSEGAGVGDVAKEKDAKAVASVNASGVLTVKPDVKAVKKIAVVAESKSKIKRFSNGKILSNVLIIDLEQISIGKITVTRKGNDKVLAAGEAVAVKNGKSWKATAAKNLPSKGTDKLSVGDKGVYNIVVEAYKANTEEKITLDGSELVGWNASGKGIVKAYKDNQRGALDALKKGNSTITINGAMWNGKKYVAAKVTFKAQVTAPSRTLKLTVKKIGIPATGKKQTVAVTPVLEKGTTTKKTEITWTAKNVTANKDFATDKIKNGKLTLDIGSYNAGDEIKVTAKIKNGPATSITLKVVEPTKSVQFNKGDSKTTKEKITDEQPITVNTLVNYGTTSVNSAVPGKDGKVSTVDYTVNKPEIVMIRKGDNGELKIIPTAKGTAKITATTLDGKKATLTVQVMEVIDMQKQNDQGILSIE